MDRIGRGRRPLAAAGLLAFLILTGLVPSLAGAAWIWVEGEKPTKSAMNRHPWWYDQVKKDQLSGGDFISNFDPKKPGLAEYEVVAPEAGAYDFWVRANPVQARAVVQDQRGRVDGDRPRQGAVGQHEHRRGRQARPPIHRLVARREGHAQEGGQRRRASGWTARTAITATSTASSSPTSHSARWARSSRGRSPRRRRMRRRRTKGGSPSCPPADPYRPTSAIDLRPLEREGGRRRRVHRREGVGVRPLEDGRARPVLGGQRPAGQGPRVAQGRRQGPGQARREPGPGPRRLLRRGRRSRPGQGPARHRDRRGDEGRGDLHPLLDLLPALVPPQGRQPLAQRVRRQDHPVRGAHDQQGLPQALPRLVEGPAHHAQQDHGQATRRRPGRLRCGIAQRGFVLLLDVQPQEHPRPAARDPRGPVRRLAQDSSMARSKRRSFPGASRGK